MRVLLDTHILLWALNDDPRLSSKALRLIENAADVYVSAATFWEMAIKVSMGKLDVDLDEIREPMKLLTSDPQVAHYSPLAILV
ncbi:type II toxin-antitoxin system VapC family toxin [Pseudomonas orientalis]|uniref:type II toxin-antitoxin system VapC family toxin n=1 Tax=Pseudomonas orientalis TaxID=76758 RepID=UPI0034D712C3